MQRRARSVATAMRSCLPLLLILGCRTAIVTSLDEAQANAVVVALDRASIASRKVPAPGDAQHFAVDVANDDVARALNQLREAGLPEPPRAGLAEAFAEPGLVPTPIGERARFIAATATEIERTLEEYESVSHARVHLAVPERDTLDGAALPANASVFLSLRSNATAVPSESDVQRLVAGAVPALAPERVTVVVTRAASHRTAPPAPFAYVGPFAVARGAAFGVKVAFTVALLLNVLLTLLVVWALRRSRPHGPTRS